MLEEARAKSRIGWIPRLLPLQTREGEEESGMNKVHRVQVWLEMPKVLLLLEKE